MLLRAVAACVTAHRKTAPDIAAADAQTVLWLPVRDELPAAAVPPPRSPRRDQPACANVVLGATRSAHGPVAGTSAPSWHPSPLWLPLSPGSAPPLPTQKASVPACP